jgi:SMC interacting uncharacterized protein involved in chromosome segregation
MHNDVKAVKSDCDTLKAECIALKDECKTSSDALNAIKTECENLKKDNAALKTQVSSLSQQLSQRVWQGFTNNDDQMSLLIGDSLIKDIDEDKLVKTQVTSLPGAKLTDVMKHLQDNDRTYSSITCCIGTNDCACDLFAGEEVSETLKNVVEVAKSKVNDPKDVRIVSVPPRTDSDDYQENVDVLNTCLSAIASDGGVSFINNDPTFKLNDGSVNDGYLLGDGLHAKEAFEPTAK